MRIARRLSVLVAAVLLAACTSGADDGAAAEDGEVAKEKLAEAMHAIKKLVKN